jgi:hypothetical protein
MIKTDAKFYHYTTKWVLDEIINSKTIRLATKDIPTNEKPVAWVSINPKWEHTSTKMLRSMDGKIHQLTFYDQLIHFGCARIQVKSDGLNTWKKLIYSARISSADVDFLEHRGRTMGGEPSEWFGSLYPIGMEKWIKAETFIDGEWVEYRIF